MFGTLFDTSATTMSDSLNLSFRDLNIVNWSVWFYFYSGPSTFLHFSWVLLDAVQIAAFRLKRNK